MANLRININNRFYDITCDKNNEKYVLELSKQYDAKVREQSLKVKNVDHSRLLVLTGIILCEELDKILKKDSKIDNPYGKNYKEQVTGIKEKYIQRINHIKDKIDSLINRIQSHNKWKFFSLGIFLGDQEGIL